MIDIIIPAYEHKEELMRAINSIANQTKKDKCIVTVVDDGSTENLYEVVEKYRDVLKINYIRNEKNLKYPGLVRQVGIDNTISPFIMFLDSDDILAPNAIEMANSEMLKTNADVIMGYFYSQKKNGIYELMDEHDSTWLHGNVYRRTFLNKYNIRFSSGYNEDGAFNTQCYLLTKKTAILPVPMYYWMNCESSLTREGDYFSVKNAGDIVTTLIFAYDNVIKNIGFEDRVCYNFGQHLGLFYHLMIEIKQYREIVEDLPSETYHNFMIFYQELENIGRLFLDRKDEVNWDFVKNGFLKKFLEYSSNDFNVDVNDFLNICDLDKQFSVTVKEIVSFLHREAEK